ncbi:MAG: ATP-binding protein, partial [Candidatus Binatia bacterium]
AWVDPSFHVRWVVAGERNNVFQNFLRVLKAQQEVTREAARKRGEITLSRVVDLLPGDKGVLVYVPIFVGRTFQGFIVGGFRVRSLFEVLFPEKTINPVSLAVWDGEQEIYHSAPTRVPPLVRGSSVEAQVNLYSAAWRMQVWPALGAMEGAQSSLPEMVLLGGYLLAGLLAVMVSVIQAARAQTRQMQAVNRVLQEHNTAHKRTEEALAKALQEQQELMKAIPDIIYTLDLAGRLIKWNVRMEIVSGFSVEELRHRPLSAFFSEESQARIGQAAEEALAKGYSAVQGWLLTKSGTAIPYQFACAPLKDDQNQVVGFAGVGRDMTERLAAERMKDEFLSVVSHELRTPLGALRGSLGLLAGGAFGPLPEKGQRMLEIAVTNTNRLMRLINDILDVERMTAGKLAMQPQACEASELMSQAVDMMQAVAERAKIALCVSPLRARLWADPDRIVQVLTNLLSNAVKFSSSDATVWLTAEQHGEQVVFQVRDEGRGIPADKLHSIFERFEQVDASDTREKGGTGLGLAICRSIVQHHKGRIWVKSALGKGSTFFFTLPVQKEEDPLPQ